MSASLASAELAEENVIDAASTLGSLKNRIEIQANFAYALSGSITSGIGRLVDADMELVSARLRAEQTSQQLAVQSLGIANAASQSILSLFNA
jgi:flagellin